MKFQVLVRCGVVILGSLIRQVDADAQDRPDPEVYRAATIPIELKNDVKAVVRFSDETFVVQDRRRATYRAHSVVTILEPGGKQYGELALYYDKFMKIGLLEGALYDADGKRLRTLEDKDISDQAAISGYSLYEDSRVRRARVHHGIYPYTVEYRFEVTYNGYLAWPTWYPENSLASVQHARFSVSVPKDLSCRYIQTRTAGPEVRQENARTVYIWTAENMPAFESEPVGPPLEEQYEHVRIAPVEFEIDGHFGDLSSWSSFGKWFYGLYRDRQTLPEGVRNEIRGLVSGATDWQETVRTLYEYLQSKTRYVSVQLGIGGWQPFDAMYVSQRGYGDCKALTNYMGSLLAAVGIQSFPALIHSSSLPLTLRHDFPVNAFNHVILCVPKANDTVWLECTSQNMPFGHIGMNNENRLALLVGPEGGTLVRTPASPADANSRIRRATVTLTSLGFGSADVRTMYTGNQQDYVRNALKEATPRDRQEWMRETIGIPAFEIKSMDFSGIENKSTSVILSMQLNLPRYASQAGSRLLFQPNLMARRSYVPKDLQHRKHPVVHSYAYIDIDSVTFRLPDEVLVEAIPKPVTIETPFARYSSGTIVSSSTELLYTRRMEILSTEIPPDQYGEYVKFLKEVAKADKSSVALVKK